MSLASSFRAQPTATETPADVSVDFDGVTGTGTIKTSTASESPPADAELDDILRTVGLDPDVFEIVGTPGGTFHFKDGAVCQVWWKIKFRAKGIALDPADLEDELRATPIPQVTTPTGDDWFHVQFGDIHLGKGADAGGGEDNIIGKYLESLALARAEFNTLDQPAGICLSFVGDLIEGHTSQNGRLIAGQDMTLTEQLRVGRRLMLRAVDTFLDTGLPILLHAIGGNHDETTRVQAQKPGDNFAVDAAIALSDAMELAPAYKHVTVTVPPDTQGHMTVPVGDTRVTYVHGHRWGSGSVETKIEKWWSGQALNGRPAGSAHLLCAGHFHSFRHLHISNNKTAIMSPSLEVESAWFAEQTGARARRGCVTYTSQAGNIQRVSVH